MGWWVDVRRFRGSTLPRCWRSVLVITLVAAAVVVGDVVYGRRLGLSNSVTPLLSLVLGLLLTARSNQAYARWENGRATFAGMAAGVRSLSRSVWVNVGAFGPPRGTGLSSHPTVDPTISEKDHEAKERALRLMVAFVVATKHHVRQEYGCDYPDLTSLLPPKFLEKSSHGFGVDAATADALARSREPSIQEPAAEEYNRLTQQQQAPSFSSRIWLLHRFRSNPKPDPDHEAAPAPTATTTAHERTPLMQHATHVSTESSAVIMSSYLNKPSLPLPLIIAHQLSLYFALCKKKGLLEAVGPAGFNALQTSVAALVKDFTNCEKLAAIPVPVVEGIHLKQAVSLYLLTLPFTLVEVLGWKMVPFVSLCAFTLIGIEGIASELEQPFGIDNSDLPLDLIVSFFLLMSGPSMYPDR